MEATSTDEKLLDAALRLMLSKGYPATTVDEICSEAGVSKGSFYHFFKTKEALGLATLARFYRHGVAEMQSGPFLSMTDPVERALGFVDHVADRSTYLWTDGCLLGGFAAELAETNPAMRRAVADMFDQLAGAIAVVFGPIGKRTGENGPSAMDLAEMFLAVLEGSILLARAHQDPERIPKAVKRFRGYLEGLIAGTH
jgi:TetR/AcrR family transcriptional repressor of nem operon